MIGRTIDQVEYPSENFRFSYTLTAGTYFVQISGKDFSIIRKIVIKK